MKTCPKTLAFGMRSGRRVTRQTTSSVTAPKPALMVRMLKGGMSSERDLHHRPADTPDQAEDDEQEPGAKIANPDRRVFAVEAVADGHGACGPVARYQSAICSPVQNFTSLLLRITSSTRRKYFNRCGAPMM